MKRIVFWLITLLIIGVLFFVFLVRTINNSKTNNRAVSQQPYIQKAIRINKDLNSAPKKFDVFKPEIKKTEEKKSSSGSSKSLEYNKIDSKSRALLM